MQQDTPQVNQPAPPVPPVPTPPTPPRPPQDDQGAAFYQPSGTSRYDDAQDHQLPAPVPAPQGGDPAPLSWEASEYVHTDKTGMWLVGFGAIVVVVLGIGIWLMAWTFVILVLVMALAMGVFAFRKPHVISYTLSDDGILIGDKTFHYSDFRAFGILEDGAFFTMTLIPIKRFAPALSVYFPEDHGEQIVDIVGSHLPMEDIHTDLIDHVMRRLRF